MKILNLTSIMISTLAISAAAFARHPDSIKALKDVSEDNRARAEQIANALQTQMKDPEHKGQIYMDLDSNVQQEVFSKPGFFSSDVCAQDVAQSGKKKASPGCQTIGALQSQTEVKATGQVRFTELPNENDEKVLAAFYEVEFPTDQGLKKGWIAGDTVSMKPSFSQIVTKQAKTTQNLFHNICNGISRISIFSSAPTDSAAAVAMASIHSSYKKQLEDQKQDMPEVSEAVKKISPLIGKCVLEPAKGQMPDAKGNVTFEAPKNLKSNIVYDEKVLPSVMKNFSNAQDLKIPRLNAQKLVEIDALARTIFAEMASCIPIGSQYSMAVARVILNRELAMEKNPNATKEFIYERNTHWPGKNDITRAASSPVQFSAWNKKIIDFEELNDDREDRVEALRKGKKMSQAKAEKIANEEIKPNAKTGAYYKFNESGLMHTLCPPSNLKEPYYDGHLPSESLHAIWQNTVKVAIEATLYPENFNKKPTSFATFFITPRADPNFTTLSK